TEARAATSPPPETAETPTGSAPAPESTANTTPDANATPDSGSRERMTPAAASRWWQRNKPTDSAQEKAILHALHEHLDELLQPPPPF
ncbi:HNH endonuclease, partial [Dietzia maris]